MDLRLVSSVLLNLGDGDALLCLFFAPFLSQLHLQRCGIRQYNQSQEYEPGRHTFLLLTSCILKAQARFSASSVSRKVHEMKRTFFSERQ